MTNVARSESNPLSFEDYVHRQPVALLRHATIVTADPAQAQDIVQTVLERAYRSWDRIGGFNHPDAFPSRMVVNEFTWSTAPRSRSPARPPPGRASPATQTGPGRAELVQTARVQRPLRAAVLRSATLTPEQSTGRLGRPLWEPPGQMFVIGVAHCDLEVPDVAQRRRSHVRVPLIQRQRLTGITGGRDQVPVEARRTQPLPHLIRGQHHRLARAGHAPYTRRQRSVGNTSSGWPGNWSS